jgi:hypothetical protein
MNILTKCSPEEIEIELATDLSDIAQEQVHVRYLNHTAFGYCKSELAALRIYKAYRDAGRIDLEAYYNKQLQIWMIKIKSSAE